MDFTGKKVLVAGMKASGISAGTLLKSLGAEVFCYDDDRKAAVANFDFLNEINEETMTGFSLVVVSPSIAPKNKVVVTAKKLDIKIISEFELGCSMLDCPQIAVTGTNGKTTVVTMIEKLLLSAGVKTKASGNIGYPVTQVVLDKTPLDYAVLEASSFQLEYIEKLKPYISVILNLAPDHLDRYESYTAYVATKRKICMNQTKDDYLVFNSDDGAAREFVKYTDATPVPVGVSEKFSKVYIKDNYFMFGDESLCSVKCCRLRGEHNRFNMLVALNVGALVGVKSEHMVRLIKDYALLPNRIEYVSTINGKNFYNDSKGTNIHACRFAIESMDGTVGLIMGGSDKNEDFCDFFENINPKVKFVAITGGNAEKIRNSALKMGFTDICVLPALEDAVKFLAKKDGVSNVLLSPCCASFDRYRNYAERGDKFREAVYAIEL